MATMSTILSVPNISCEHCERTVKTALTPLDGVTDVSVDIPAKRVTVAYDPDRVNVELMSTILEQEDFPVANTTAAS